MRRTRQWTARQLRRLAMWLDPAPTVQRADSGWSIEFHGVPLAKIESGMVRHLRGNGQSW